MFFFAAITFAAAQNDYKVIDVNDGGTISGTIRWGGAVPHEMDFPITKDTQICDPEGKKSVSLERLIIGPEGGVANTIVYLNNISAGKAMELPEQRRHLDQKHCRYVPHILLVPENSALQMQSSDATLHIIHMDGAASFNLPFPFTNQVTARTMARPGLVNLRCNGGHVWMNAEMMVVHRIRIMLLRTRAEGLNSPACLPGPIRSLPGMKAGVWWEKSRFTTCSPSAPCNGRCSPNRERGRNR